MSNSGDSSTSRSEGDEFAWFQRRNQVLWACSVTILFAMIVWNLVAGRMFRPPLIDVDNAVAIEYQFVIDINNADWTDFTVLPGISETYARRIVDYRDANGPFATIDGLMQVSGIGPKRLNAVREYLTIDSLELPAE